MVRRTALNSPATREVSNAYVQSPLASSNVTPQGPHAPPALAFGRSLSKSTDAAVEGTTTCMETRHE
jgi:hypothetical protein